jgi:hypothetical protein
MACASAQTVTLTFDNIVTNISPAPEPGQAAMLGLGLAGLLLFGRRARRA